MILLDITTAEYPLSSTLPEPADLDLWWNDVTEGEFPLLGRDRLAALLLGLAERGFIMVHHRESGRRCQALGMNDAMVVEVAVGTVEQSCVARTAQPQSKRTFIETYSGRDHLAQEREIHTTPEACDLMWLWVTTGQLPPGYTGQNFPVSIHRRAAL